jgi:hypothetical protein
MKATFFLSMLGLAATAVANPLPGADGQTLERMNTPTLPRDAQGIVS